MARKGINIAVASDTRAFSKGIADGVVEPLEDVAKSLDDVARDGDRAGDKLEDAMRQAQRETEDLKQEHKDLNDVISKGSKTAFKKMETAAEQSYDNAGDAAQDMKDEGKSAFGEMAGSFDGSLDSMAGSAQGFLGGLAASGGPIALAAGSIALAAGAFYNQWQQKTEAAKQRVSDMYADMIESQQDFLSETYKLEEFWKILKNEDGAVLGLDKAEEYAKRTGLTVQQVALAWAGDAAQMEIVMERLGTAIDDNSDKAKSANADQQQYYNDQVAWDQVILRNAQARNDEIDVTIDKVQKGRATWNTYGSDAGKALGEQNRQLGVAIDKAGTLREAAKQIPNKLAIAATVTADTKAIDNTIKRLENGVVKIKTEFVTRTGRRIQ